MSRSARIKKAEMPCNKPRSSPRKGKRKVVKACKDGEKKIVHYGQEGVKPKSSKAKQKSFNARHKCSEKKDKLSASYWACKDW